VRTYRMRDVLTQRLREEWRDVLNARPPDQLSDLLDRLRRPEEASQLTLKKPQASADSIQVARKTGRRLSRDRLG
jgi:hypothetical protein